MMLHLAIRLGLLAQGVAVPPSPRTGTPPVRVWLPDTLVPVGEPARVYVALRDTSYLAVLHVDASGRIRVLFPRSPVDPDLVPGGETFAVAGAEDSVTFRVPGPGTGSVLAVRSHTPFRFDGLVAGNRWDYERSLLLLPTAGNPFAALLDIADRIADGEAYNYDLAAYRTPGALAARATPPDSVCFGCLAARHSGGRAAETGGLANSALAVDHSLAAVSGGTAVDCSNATLVDSFCGVEDNSVTTNVAETTVTQSTSVVYPVYTPLFFPLRRVRRPPRAPAPPPQPAIALNLRRVPGRIVPPPPRRPPRIAVDQPWAPSHPDALTPEAPPVPAVNAATAPGRVFVRRAPPASMGSGPSTSPAAAWGGMEGRRFATTAVAARPAGAGAAAPSAAPARPVLVPSAAVARAYRNRPR